jgi:predicted PurR-regulated permease PerM
MGAEDGSETGARLLLLVASFVVVIAGIKAAAALILPFLVAVFVALVSLPLLNWLQGRRVPTPIAVLATVALALVALVGLAVLIGGTLTSFTDQVPRYRARLHTLYTPLLDYLASWGIEISQDTVRELVDPGAAMDIVTGTLRGVAAVLSNLLLVLLIVVFILSEAAGFPAKIAAAFGSAAGSERFDKIKLEVQRYLATKTVISLATGSLVALALSIIGVDFALLWGVVAFMLNYIPNLGSIIAAIPPTLLAAVQLGAGHAIAVAVVFTVINVAFGNLLEPYLMGRRLGLSTLVIFLSLVFWGWVWGPVGMLLSVPLTMIAKIMLENTDDLRWVAVLLGPSPKPEQLRRADQARGAGKR